MSDTQLRKALEKSFNEVDKTNSGHIMAKDVETVLTHFNNNPEVIKKLDTTHIKQKASHFLTSTKDKDKKITMEEFMDYYGNRLTHW